jgi:hypothetical protein
MRQSRMVQRGRAEWEETERERRRDRLGEAERDRQRGSRAVSR